MATGRQSRAEWRERGWLTPREFAAEIGASVRTAKWWCLTGRVHTLPREDDRGDYKIPASELARLRGPLPEAARALLALADHAEQAA